MAMATLERSLRKHQPKSDLPSSDDCNMCRPWPKLQFPDKVETKLRFVIVLCSKKAKRVNTAELTVPWEKGYLHANQFNKGKNVAYEKNNYFRNDINYFY